MENAPRIKVLHIATRMNVGGVAVLIDNLLTNIDHKTFEPILLTGICEEPEANYLEGSKPNYEVVSLSTFHKSFRFFNEIATAINMAKFIRSTRPHIVHTHTSKAGVIGRVITSVVLPQAKIVHTFHGHLLFGYFSKFKLQVVIIVERVMALLTDNIITMGTQVKKDLLKAGIANERKFQVLLPGINNPTFLEKKLARNNLNLSQSKIYCVFVGRLTNIKRPDRILEVASNLHKSCPNLEFLIVGQGELIAELKTSVEESFLPINFLGWSDDVAMVLAASDLLILTSDNEAVALALIEAAQAGLPVVTTNAGSISDVVLDGQSGFVTSFDTNDLSSAVQKLYESKSLRFRMGARGREIVRERFSIQKMVLDHELLYQELKNSHF